MTTIARNEHGRNISIVNDRREHAHEVVDGTSIDTQPGSPGTTDLLVPCDSCGLHSIVVVDVTVEGEPPEPSTVRYSANYKCPSCSARNVLRIPTEGSE